MTKEFGISDILSAVNSIEKKHSPGKNDILTLNNQVKSDKSEILVLDQMIE